MNSTTSYSFSHSIKETLFVIIFSNISLVITFPFQVTNSLLFFYSSIHRTFVTIVMSKKKIHTLFFRTQVTNTSKRSNTKQSPTSLTPIHSTTISYIFFLSFYLSSVLQSYFLKHFFHLYINKQMNHLNNFFTSRISHTFFFSNLFVFLSHDRNNSNTQKKSNRHLFFSLSHMYVISQRKK